jgi:signal recognition particle subunit SRP54
VREQLSAAPARASPRRLSARRRSEKFDAEETAKIQEKMMKGQLTLNDFMDQMKQVRKLGSIGRIMNMLPGMSQLQQQLNLKEGDMENQVAKMQAIYNSMNKKERLNTDIIDAPRRKRIARGAGVQPPEVGQFIKQFETSRDMMRAFGGMNSMSKMRMMGSLMRGGLAGLGQGGFPIRTKKSTFMEKKDRNKKKRR